MVSGFAMLSKSLALMGVRPSRPVPYSTSSVSLALLTSRCPREHSARSANGPHTTGAHRAKTYFRSITGRSSMRLHCAAMRRCAGSVSTTFATAAGAGTGINDNGGLFLHGANIGTEYRW